MHNDASPVRSALSVCELLAHNRQAGRGLCAYSSPDHVLCGHCLVKLNNILRQHYTGKTGHTVTIKCRMHFKFPDINPSEIMSKIFFPASLLK